MDQEYQAAVQQWVVASQLAALWVQRRGVHPTQVLDHQRGWQRGVLASHTMQGRHWQAAVRMMAAGQSMVPAGQPMVPAGQSMAPHQTHPGVRQTMGWIQIHPAAAVAESLVQSQSHQMHPWAHEEGLLPRGVRARGLVVQVAHPPWETWGVAVTPHCTTVQQRQEGVQQCRW